MTTNLSLKLHHLPNSLSMDDAVGIELVEGVLIFRASSLVQEKMKTLIAKKQESALTSEEEKELDKYEELGDYLSLVNQTVRNVLLNPIQGRVLRYDDPFEPSLPPEDWEVLR